MSTTVPNDLPLNIYVIVLGTGLLLFMLSLIFCCFFFRVRHHRRRNQFGYNEVVLKGKEKTTSLIGVCAVCLEEFKVKDELGICPCAHAFHRKCLVKWLEIRSVCPMCNKTIPRLVDPCPDLPTAEAPQV
ncbi:RING finger protein 122 isoform X2 [Latimeria chalumnae]|uniref:RING finger protein 122 isoform X2 n=1 Tax=Latimeria chalumnae TaxID=7897 RepID=UPI00313E765D